MRKNRLRFICTGDWHLGASVPAIRSVMSPDQWLDYQRNVLGCLKAEVTGTGRTLLAAGDIFDKPTMSRFNMIPLLGDVVNYFKDCGRFVPGQHDIPWHDAKRMVTSSYGLCAQLAPDAFAMPRPLPISEYVQAHSIDDAEESEGLSMEVNFGSRSNMVSQTTIYRDIGYGERLFYTLVHQDDNGNDQSVDVTIECVDQSEYDDDDEEGRSSGNSYILISIPWGLPFDKVANFFKKWTDEYIIHVGKSSRLPIVVLWHTPVSPSFEKSECIQLEHTNSRWENRVMMLDDDTKPKIPGFGVTSDKMVRSFNRAALVVTGDYHIAFKHHNILNCGSLLCRSADQTGLNAWKVDSYSKFDRRELIVQPVPRLQQVEYTGNVEDWYNLDRIALSKKLLQDNPAIDTTPKELQEIAKLLEVWSDSMGSAVEKALDQFTSSLKSAVGIDPKVMNLLTKALRDVKQESR